MLEIDQLVRCKRRSIGLTVTKDAQLVVRAPLWMPAGQIEAFVCQKQDWINEKQAFFRQRSKKSKRFVRGEEFLFLGRAYRLEIVDDLPKAVVLSERLMVSNMVLKNAAEHIRNWYQIQALEHIGQRVEFFANAAGLCYRTVKVNNAQGRWGSCSYNGNLNFTWKLIMAPPRVVDYVVVHELMHLKQRNHSVKFWAEVRKMVCDYEQDERWLKENGYLLGL